MVPEEHKVSHKCGPHKIDNDGCPKCQRLCRARERSALTVNAPLDETQNRDARCCDSNNHQHNVHSHVVLATVAVSGRLVEVSRLLMALLQTGNNELSDQEITTLVPVASTNLIRLSAAVLLAGVGVERRVSRRSDSLQRQQLRGRSLRLRASEVSGELDRRWSMVLFQVGTAD